MRTISVVIPVYNNEESLYELNEQVSSVLMDLKTHAVEIVYVDDGSQDRSFDRLLLIKRENSLPTTIVKLAGNFGQKNAVLAGFSRANNELVATISADLQDPPGIIREMYKALGDGKIVIAERSSRGDSLGAKVASRITYFFMRLVNRDIPRRGFDCWMVDAKILNYLVSRNRGLAMIQANFFANGFKVDRITYKRNSRPFGKSGWMFRSKIQAFLEVFSLGMSSLARHMIIVGALLSIFALLMFSLILVSFFKGDSPFQGFTFLASSLTLFCSFLMITSGSTLTLLSQVLESQGSAETFVIDAVI